MAIPAGAERRTGFSLVELLVVVAIIAIVASILYPVFLHAKVRAKVARVHTELNQVAAAIQLYCDDNNGRPPLASESCEKVSVQDYYELPPPLYRYISARRYYDPFNPGRTYKYLAPGIGYVNGALSTIKLYVPSDYPVSGRSCVAYYSQETSPIKWAVWSVGPSGGFDLFEFQDKPARRFPCSRHGWYPRCEKGIVVRLSDGRASP
jgi:prepilin-type N-terminal cleavage/methylation domain-containing protein